MLDILKKKLLSNTQLDSHSHQSVHSHIISITANLRGKKKKKSASPVVYICIVLIINETECLLKLQFQRMSGWVHLKHQKREVAPGTKT